MDSIHLTSRLLPFVFIAFVKFKSLITKRVKFTQFERIKQHWILVTKLC